MGKEILMNSQTAETPKARRASPAKPRAASAKAAAAEATSAEAVSAQVADATPAKGAKATTAKAKTTRAKTATAKAKAAKAKAAKAKAAKAKTTKAAKATTAKATKTAAATETQAGTRAPRGRRAAQKILFAVSEVAPFVSTGGMGQVVSSLPVTLQRTAKNLDVRVIAPYYQHVRQQFGAGMAFLGSIQVQLSWRSHYCGVFQIERDGVTYYFIDNEQYFDREACYGYFDDGERFAFFSKAVLSVLEMIGYMPDIIHAHDWQTALIPIYLKTVLARFYPQIRTVFTIHNIEYQGKFTLDALQDVCDLRSEDYGIVEYESNLNLVKGAIICADKLTTVSPSYAEEIKYGGGYGLEPILLMHQGKLQGILNGIDTDLYNPATDPSLAQTFTEETLEDKAVNKRDLQTLFGLPAAPRKPLLCMISRLVSHKGLDLLLSIMEDLLSDDVQFLLLGTGDLHYELFFNEMAICYPDKVAVNIAYNPEIGNKIYAGADMMLMPSRSEPCGLSQMIASRYATIPVVRATGGLKDTITDCRNGNGNGFLFENYDAAEFLSTIRQAIHLYTYYEDDWQNLMRDAMRRDFRWDLSAKAYVEMYASLRTK